MNSAWKVQQFLKLKIDQNKLDKKEFSRTSDIPYSTLCKIINGFGRNTELKTILKIADYFSCSIDEVIGRDSVAKAESVSYKHLTKEEAGNNLKKFLGIKLREQSLNSYQLAKKCGFSDIALYEFMKSDTSSKNLGSSVIIGLANYFNVSLDEIIGRTGALNKTSKTMPAAINNLSSEDLKILDKAKESIDTNLQKGSDSKILRMKKSNKTSITK